MINGKWNIFSIIFTIDYPFILFVHCIPAFIVLFSHNLVSDT